MPPLAACRDDDVTTEPTDHDLWEGLRDAVEADFATLFRRHHKPSTTTRSAPPRRGRRPSPTATPTPEPTFTRERLRAHVFPPASATGPAVMQVEGPAARAIGGIVIDTTTDQWVGELNGHIGSGGIGTLQFAAPAGGWKAGHSYYFQAFTPDGSTNAARGGFEVRAGVQGPAPTPAPTPIPTPATRRPARS
ncbi:hypothetical protein GCM10027418_08040 [Mariniluteicoccus endophyticus]